jgi:aminoglycoside 6'-N-acetyltransferase
VAGVAQAGNGCLTTAGRLIATCLARATGALCTPDEERQAMNSGDECALPVEFDGGRLRRLRADDLACFQAYRAIPELGRYQGWTPMSAADAATFLARMQDKPLLEGGQWLQLGIGDAASDDLVGDIGIYLADDGLRAEIGFTLAPAAQGRGIATAAVGAAVALVFAKTGVREVAGIADRRNTASVRLLQRVGFERRESRQGESRGEPCTEDVFVLRRGAATAPMPRQAISSRPDRGHAGP